MALMVGELAALLSLDNQPFERGLMASGSGMDSLKRAAVAAAVGIGAAMAGGAAYSLLKFSDFEAGMNEVFTLMPGISQSAMDDMTGQVQSFATEFGVLPEKVIPALYQSLSAGVPPGNVFDFLETSQKLARAGATDLETAVDGLTSTVNAYGQENLSAAEASDVMVTAVRVGKTTVRELSDALFQVNPIAASVGIGFGDIAAAMSAMTAQGVPTSVAATQLRQMLTELSTEGSEVNTTFSDLAGKGFRDFIAGGGTMEEALGMLSEYSDSTGGSISDLFGSVEAGQAALALTGEGAETFADNLAAMGGAAGATEAAYDQMTEGIRFQLDKLKAYFAVAVVRIGELVARIAEPILEFGGQLADAFSAGGLPGALDFLQGKFDRLDGPMKLIVAGGAALVAVLTTGGLIALIGGLAAAIGSVVSPIALIVVGIAALAAGLVYAYNEWDGFRQVVDSVVSWLVGTAWPWIQEFAANVAEQWANLVQWTREHWDQISEAITRVVNAVQIYVGAWVAWFRTFWSVWGDEIVAIATAAWQLVRSTVENAVAGIAAIIELVLAVINGDWGEAWTAVKEILSAVWAQMGAVIGFWLQTIWAVLTGAISALLAFWAAAWRFFVDLVSTAWQTAVSVIAAGIGVVLSFLSALPGRILGALASLPGLLISVGAALMRGLLAGISAAWGAVSGWLGGVGGRILSAVGSLGSILLGAGRSIINGLLDGMQDAWGAVSGWLSDRAGQIANLKGPIEKDRRLLEPIGQAIIGGLEAGMKRRWVGVARTLAGMTNSLSVTTDRAATRGALAAGTTYIDESRFIVVRSIDEAAAHVKPARQRQVADFLHQGMR